MESNDFFNGLLGRAIPEPPAATLAIVRHPQHLTPPSRGGARRLSVAIRDVALEPS
jgi:hypothetical protein